MLFKKITSIVDIQKEDEAIFERVLLNAIQINESFDISEDTVQELNIKKRPSSVKVSRNRNLYIFIKLIKKKIFLKANEVEFKHEIIFDRVLIDVVQFVEHVETLEAKPEPKLIREKSAKVSRPFLSNLLIC